MATTIKFTKMQGTGNDYIYVNTLSSPLQDPIKAARKWSAYHTGIGADGLVLIGVSEKADFSMHIFNADGSEAMMCGNASRCIGKYVYEKGLTDKEVITLETLSGIKILKLHTGNGVVKDVTVDMGMPLLSNPGQIATKTGGMLAETILADGKEYKGTFVCMGNPHVVIFVDDIKVWERGSGITMACGTGACATAVAAVLNHKAGRKSWVRMDGGDLHIHWDEKDGHVYMTGPAGKVFEGEIEM